MEKSETTPPEVAHADVKPRSFDARAAWYYSTPKKKKQVISISIMAVVTVFLAVYFIGFRKTRDTEMPTFSNETELREYILENGDDQRASGDYLILGNEYLRSGKIEQAEQNYKKALALDSGDASVQHALAKFYASQKNQSVALKHYDELIKIASNKDSSFYSNLPIFIAERKAVAAGDFEFKNISGGYPTNVPL